MYLTVTDVTQPFDLTYKLANASLSNGNEGWSQDATFNYGCAEFYQTTFDFNQTVGQLPAGTYQFCVNGFQRPGTAAAAYTAYSNGKNNVNANIYMSTKYQKICHICDTMLTTKMGVGNESTLANSRYVPNDMQSGSAYFAKGLYENRLTTTVNESNSSLKMGIRSASMITSYWVMFDNFRLFFYGRMSEEELGVQAVTNGIQTGRKDIYTLDGRRLSPDAQLRPGLYIVNGRKVVVR